MCTGDPQEVAWAADLVWEAWVRRVNSPGRARTEWLEPELA